MASFKAEMRSALVWTQLLLEQKVNNTISWRLRDVAKNAAAIIILYRSEWVSRQSVNVEANALSLGHVDLSQPLEVEDNISPTV